MLLIYCSGSLARVFLSLCCICLLQVRSVLYVHIQLEPFPGRFMLEKGFLHGEVTGWQDVRFSDVDLREVVFPT